MFVLDRNRHVKWPVTVDVPIDGGDTLAHTFEVTFRLAPLAELQKAEAFTDVIVGWNGVNGTDAEGRVVPLPFSADNLQAMLSFPFVLRGIRVAFAQVMTGARRKNLETPPAGGQAAEAKAPATT